MFRLLTKIKLELCTDGTASGLVIAIDAVIQVKHKPPKHTETKYKLILKCLVWHTQHLCNEDNAGRQA